MKISQFSIRITLLVIISMLNILIATLVGSGVYRSWENLDHIRTLKKQTTVINLLYNTEKYLSLERALSMAVIKSSSTLIAAMHKDLLKNRENADAKLDEALSHMKGTSAPDLNPVLQKVLADRQRMQEMRKMLDGLLKSSKDGNESYDQVFDTLTGAITDIETLIKTLSRPVIGVNTIVAQQILFKHFIWEITEYAGREYAQIARLIVENKEPSPALQEKLIAWNNREDMDWDMSRQFAQNGALEEKMAAQIEEARTHYYFTFDQIKDMFFSAGPDRIKPPYPLSIELWLDMAFQAMNSLLGLKDTALEETATYVSQLEQEAKDAIIVRLFMFACALGLSLYSWHVIVQRVIKPVSTMADSLYREAHSTAPQKMAQEDEIGKLSLVLDAFKDKAREVERVSEERLHYLKNLEDSNRELDDFAYITSHDLKEPLRGLHNFSRFLLEDYEDKLDDDGKSMLHTIADLTQRMDDLLSSLLHYSRLGRTELSVRETDLNEIVRNVMAMHSVKIRECNADVRIPEKLPLIVCDSIRITEVFQNLIGNALKYSDKKDKKIEIGFTRNYPGMAGQIVYFVKDNGIGIEKKNLDNIFKIFRRLHPRDAYGGGTGSGLTIARKIITRHGGDIWAESEGKDKGTTFFFTIPQQQKPMKHAA